MCTLDILVCFEDKLSTFVNRRTIQLKQKSRPSPALRHPRVSALLELFLTFFSWKDEYGFPDRKMSSVCVRTSLN